MEWIPEGTVRNALWIGGGQWAGKSTVATLLADRYGLTRYHQDANAARGHEDRRIAEKIRRGEPPTETDWDEYWVRTDPRETADRLLEDFPPGFRWILDDLRAFVSPYPIVAEGWGLRPELVAAVTDPGRMVVLAPTDAWQEHQGATVPRAGRVSARVSDPARAQRNRIERDRLITADAVRNAKHLGIRVITVDGSRGPAEVTDEVADHFSAFMEKPAARRHDRPGDGEREHRTEGQAERPVHRPVRNEPGRHDDRADEGADEPEIRPGHEPRTPATPWPT